MLSWFKQLVNKIPNSEPDEDVIRFQVQQFKKKVGELLKAKPESKKKKVKNRNLTLTLPKNFWRSQNYVQKNYRQNWKSFFKVKL